MSGWCELHTKRNWEHCSFTTFCERWMKRLYRGNKSQCVYAQRACARSLHMYGLGERASQEIPIQRMHGSNASGLGGMSIISRVLESIRKDAFGCSVVHSERPVSARRSRIFVCVLLSMVINKANASCRLANACGKALKPSLLACVKTGLRAQVSHSMVSRWLKKPLLSSTFCMLCTQDRANQTWSTWLSARRFFRRYRSSATEDCTEYEDSVLLIRTMIARHCWTMTKTQ